MPAIITKRTISRWKLMCVTALALGCVQIFTDHGARHMLRSVEAGEGDHDFEPAVPDLQLVSAEEVVE
jgi:hypothetical protein